MQLIAREGRLRDPRWSPMRIPYFQNRPEERKEAKHEKNIGSPVGREEPVRDRPAGKEEGRFSPIRNREGCQVDRTQIDGRTYSDEELMNLYCKSRPVHRRDPNGPRKCRTGDVINQMYVKDKLVKMPSFNGVK